MQIYIVGAGISGAVCAREFAELGHKVLILEKRNHIAGNIYDEKINDITVQKYGPHIYHSNDKIASNYLLKYTKLNFFRNCVEGFVKNKLIPIPFNFQGIDEFFSSEASEIKNKLSNYFHPRKRISIFELLASTDSQITRVGDFIFKNIFKNYSEKMWGLDPLTISKNILNRVPVALSYEKNYFNDFYEGIPINGYTDVVKKMIDHKNIEVKLNYDATKSLILKKEGTFLQNKKITAPIIYCGPIDELCRFKYGELPYRSLKFEFENVQKEYFQKTAVINYPEHPSMTRITEYKFFLNEKAPHTIISREFPGEYEANSKDFGVRYYPLGTDEAKAKYLLYKNELLQFRNLFLLGRLATYQYINMDQAIALSLEMVEKIKKSFYEN